MKKKIAMGEGYPMAECGSHHGAGVKLQREEKKNM